MTWDACNIRGYDGGAFGTFMISRLTLQCRDGWKFRIWKGLIWIRSWYGHFHVGKGVAIGRRKGMALGVRKGADIRLDERVRVLGMERGQILIG